MESPSSQRFGNMSTLGLTRTRTPKHGHSQEPQRYTPVPKNNNNNNNNNKHCAPLPASFMSLCPPVSTSGVSLHDPLQNESAEGKKKGRPRTEGQELRNITAPLVVQWKEEFKRRSRVKCPRSGCWLEFPSIYGVKYHYQRCQGAPVPEKLSHGCPYCEAVFATKVRLEKHKLWNHPDRVTMDPKEEQAIPHKMAIKSTTKKRRLENAPPSPVFFKVKKINEVPSMNGKLSYQKSDRNKQQTAYSQPSQPQSVLLQSQSRSGAKESKESSLSPLFPDQDPERVKHRRKQKTPKKFTGEQPSISGTFGLKGMTKVEEKLKTSHSKRPGGGRTFSEKPERRPAPSQLCKKDAAAKISGMDPGNQWQQAVPEQGEVVCPTCSFVTRKSMEGLKKHMEICHKLQDALKCQQCHKQFRSKAGLNYHTMAEHITKLISGEPKARGKKEQCQPEKIEWQEKTASVQHSEKEKEIRDEDKEKQNQREETLEKMVQNASQVEDFERTPSGRVRRRSAQVAVFHLQEIAEDELAKEWGTKRRIKDDLVPDSKRLNYTRPSLTNFSPEILETWKNQVKEKGFICCTNEKCDAVYSSVSGLKAHLANCSQDGGELRKYICLICQKEFSSESGVKYHISKTHSQNWFRAADNELVSSNKSKALVNNANGAEMRNNPTSGKKRGRKPN
ncbi:zinc finger protein 512B [Cynoglossus semilaevis]|uniref:zinc finger protein 512B n=1 Tax=Cynoglossus semilaevis TaxID=244447 RepID=UPI000497FBBB|nr:zinc finger protein 512B [Cynoglossus semilaevis]XP_008316162.1 zinc finger protein 512B [Cynoglossus semilaevis]